MYYISFKSHNSVKITVESYYLDHFTLGSCAVLCVCDNFEISGALNRELDCELDHALDLPLCLGRCHSPFGNNRFLA